jgi:serine/threonine protein kinase
MFKDGVVKIGGFGLSRQLEEDQMTMSLMGTMCYLPPEMAFGFAHNSKVDVWGLGVLLFAMLFFAFPFGNHASQIN